MSYQVLARKWRPKTFESLVGQEHVVRALTHALTAGRLHHAYLFTGTRGVGKTTIARILAKALNCETGLTATPCGVCNSCMEIDAGRFVDLLEVDAATNTRVDEMRVLLENAIYAPTRGRYKVYVIDEVHMLSNSAFNAMLKTLEEPPEHVKFILATTDPQKIPVTVLSRCLQFNLKQMPQAQVAGHLHNILEAEDISYESNAIALIAKAAKGSMRDALSLLDQAIAHGAGTVEFDQVQSMLGTVDNDSLEKIISALVRNDIGAMIEVAHITSTRNLSFDDALQGLATIFVEIQLAQLTPSARGKENTSKYSEYARSFSPEFVQLAYQILVHGRKELPLAPDPLSGFLMTLLRLAAFLRESDKEAPILATTNVQRGEKSTAIKSREPISMPVATSKASTTYARAVEIDSSVPALSADKVPHSASNDDWGSIVAELSVSGMARELAQHCQLKGMTEQGITLCLASSQKHLLLKPAQNKLQSSLEEYFAKSLRLIIDIDELVENTPAEVAQKQREERQAVAEKSVGQDVFVKEVITTFDASVVENSIKPIIH